MGIIIKSLKKDFFLGANIFMLENIKNENSIFNNFIIFIVLEEFYTKLKNIEDFFKNINIPTFSIIKVFYIFSFIREIV
jgi:hypothetical protein